MITQKEIFSAQRKIADVAGKKVLIAGAGITACLFGLFLKQRGVHVTIAARRTDALAQAQSLGIVDQVRPLSDAQRLPPSYDALIDTTGSIAVIRALVETALRPGAPVYPYAVYVDKEKDAFFADLAATRPIQRVDPAEASVHEEVVTMIRQGRLDPSPFITGCFRLSEYQKAWESVIGRHSLKTGILFGARA
jgi:threonine dehydrogenase-like Zn-dependent dehydrogenase